MHPAEKRRRSDENGRGSKVCGDAERLSTGNSSKGRSCVAGKCRAVRSSTGAPGTETRRTPGSVAGCNKPATGEAEETIEVARNHGDGTGLRGWEPSEPKRRQAAGAGVDASLARRWRGEGHIARYALPRCVDGNPGEKVSY